MIRNLCSNKNTVIFATWKQFFRRFCATSKPGYPPGTHHTGITAYNSLIRLNAPIMTKNSQLLTWYMCGPTVYDHSHIGHAWYYSDFS